jgi:hypothetical protein
MESNGETRYALIRDLRNRVVDLEANQCTNPLRSELTCEMLVRDNDNLRKRVADLEAQQSSLREKIERLRDLYSDSDWMNNPALLEYARGKRAAFSEVLALLSSAVVEKPRLDAEATA